MIDESKLAEFLVLLHPVFETMSVCHPKLLHDSAISPAFHQVKMYRLHLCLVGILLKLLTFNCWHKKCTP